MLTLENFCRVCLKQESLLVDLEDINDDTKDTLFSKLQECVREVDWSTMKPILCNSCVRRLNNAFAFKRKCIQSVNTLKSYMNLLQQQQNAVIIPQDSLVVPEANCIKIILPPTKDPLENVVVNLSPQLLQQEISNQNILTNVHQNFVPVVVANSQTVNQLLNESSSEELSVEIDPTDFDMSECSPTTPGSEDFATTDWDEVISTSSLINPEKKEISYISNFVPILPKQSSSETSSFTNFGQHFLSAGEFKCHKCDKVFLAQKKLDDHLEFFHFGERQFKCQFCSSEFESKADYDFCVSSHQLLETKSEIIHDDEQEKIGPKKKYFIKGQKAARCNICNKDFSTHSYLQIHKQLHSRDKFGYRLKVLAKKFYPEK